MIGGGINALAAAAFMVCDGNFARPQITIFDAAGDPEHGYHLRGGRMLTTDNCECTWDLFKTILSLVNPGLSVFDETVAVDAQYQPDSKALLVDGCRAKVPVSSMGFSMKARFEAMFKALQ
ncbi:Putative myosin-cross-reactive antigen [Oxalobacteraceae bacterium IMCC9480]|nr:Putative myosin-cross-reactive antigen [Oxalobacteraceae bacterium IMCC9480]